MPRILIVEDEPDIALGLQQDLLLEGYEVDVVNDSELVAHQAYGAYGEKKLYGKIVEGVIRSTFVVGTDGKIEVAQYNVKATGHVAKLRKDLQVA